MNTINATRPATPRSLRLPLRRFAAASGCVAASALGVSALAPASTPVLNAVAPASAQAFAGGWDRDHYWIKVTRGEVASGAVAGICGRYVPVGRRTQVCTPTSQAARQMIGGNQGFWAEAWPGGCSGNTYVRTSRGWAVVPNCWPPRFRFGTW